MCKRQSFWNEAGVWFTFPDQRTTKLISILVAVATAAISFWIGTTTAKDTWKQITVGFASFLFTTIVGTSVEMWFKGGRTGAKLMEQLRRPTVASARDAIWAAVETHKDTEFRDGEHEKILGWFDEIATVIGHYLGAYRKDQFRTDCCGTGPGHNHVHFGKYQEHAVNYVRSLLDKLSKEDIV